MGRGPVRRHILLGVLGVLGLVLVALFVATRVGYPGYSAPPGRVYSLGEVRAGLRSHPRAWIGQTVWVRGEAVDMAVMLANPLSTSGLPHNVDYLSPPPGVLVRIRLVPPTYNLRSRQDIRKFGTQFVVSPHLGPQGVLVSFLRDVPLIGRLAPLNTYGRLMTMRFFRITPLPVHCRYLYQPDCADALLQDLHR